MPSASEIAVTEWIGAKLREMRGEGGDEVSYDKIAADLGITKPQIYSLVKHGRGAGQKVEQVFADKFFNSSIDKLRKTAREWWEKRNAYVHLGDQHVQVVGEPPSPPYLHRSLEETDRYASRAEVLADKANANRWTDAARAAARSLQLKSDKDPGPEWWIRMLDEMDLNMRSLARITGNPLADLDEPPPKRPVRTAREKR